MVTHGHGFYNKVRNCSLCPHMDTEFEHQRQIKRSSSDGTLEFVATDLLGSIPRAKKGNQFMVIVTNRYRKLTRAVPIAKITSTKVASVFFYGWAVHYSVPDVIQSSSGQKFVIKLLTTL